MTSARASGMRPGLVLGAALLAVLASRTAAAERRVLPSWAAPALEVTLLDGFRTRGATFELGRRSVTPREPAEPGQELSVAVERMWSQVRAYRRPGGAELVVRGRF